ncbi:MAG: zinc ribbon domain-containing protein [Bacteroidetes bacterium]|nr:MAG: zinc ribbon domain-containing protein [Bacteroidota bacterium]
MYHVTPFTENAGSLQGRLGNLAGGIIYLGTASNFFRRSRLLLDTYRFESIFLYVDIEGTIGKSEITAGKAVTDSLETRNIVIRSDSQFRIYTTKILSECLKLNGERYITAMVTDSQVEQATERVMQAISNFRDEGVSIRGIDVSADSLDQITRANAIIQSNKRQQSRISLANQEQKKAIGIRKDAGADFPPQESEADISTTEADTKECPRCAEIIRAKAVYCRFCGFEIGSPAGEHPVNE